MYLIDAYAVYREHGTMDRLAFALECHGNVVYWAFGSGILEEGCFHEEVKEAEQG